LIETADAGRQTGVDLTVAGLSFRDRSPENADSWALADESLAGSAGARTDLFVDPDNGTATLNAPRLLTSAPAGDFQLAARVEVGFESTYDAGVLLLWAGDDIWAKLCFEFSPQGQPMVVSVVTRGRSDDANGFIVEGSSVWLRITGRRGAYAFHASTDGEWWHLIRHFTLGDVDAEVGFEVQSPVGQGCRATFTDVTYRLHTLIDLRDGA
jgi:regulation of enolase protein 1 (concanavalin A-like superfamily)